MNNGIWVALGLGFLGSLHCVGMCGPLVLALPQPQGEYGRWAMLVGGRVLYNIGRALTYALLGLGVGLIGGAARFSGLQQVVSITSGVLILLWLMLPKNLANKASVATSAARLINRLRVLLSPVLRMHFLSSQFGLGVLNGLLPCGLVFVALAGALAQETVLASSGFMALFGLGTFPAMLAFSILTGKLKNNFSTSLRRLLPIGLAAIAILLILRGLALDIPYISPAPGAHATTAASHSCH